MPKHNIDDILSDLGIHKRGREGAGGRERGQGEAARGGRIDEADPGPPPGAAPDLGGLARAPGNVSAGAAVTQAPTQAPHGSAGSGLSEIYIPDEDASLDRAQLGETLVARGVITA